MSKSSFKLYDKLNFVQFYIRKYYWRQQFSSKIKDFMVMDKDIEKEGHACKSLLLGAKQGV